MLDNSGHSTSLHSATNDVSLVRAISEPTSRDLLKILYNADELPVQFKLGIYVANRLDKVAALIPSWHALHAATCAAARHVRAASNPIESEVSLSRADHGHVELRSLWALMILNHGRTEGTPADPLRALVLLHAWEGQTDDLRALAQQINAFVKKLDAEPDLNSTFHLKAYLAQPGLGLEAARSDLESAMSQCSASKAARTALRRLLEEADKFLIHRQDVARANPIEGGSRIQRSWMEGAPDKIRTRGGEEALLSKPDRNPVPANMAQRTTMRSAYLMQKSFLNSHTNALTVKESRATTDALLPLLNFEGDFPTDHAQSAFIMLLELVSSLGCLDIRADLERLVHREAKHLRIETTGSFLIQPIPYKRDFYRLPPQLKNLVPWKSEAEFPLPAVIHEFLQRIMASKRVVTHSAFIDEGRVLRSQLRRVIHRFSEERSRKAFAATTFEITEGDNSIVYLLTGQDYEQLTSSLAYFGMDQVDATALWSTVVHRLTGLDCPNHHPEGGRPVWLGAPLAGLPDEVCQSLTAGYVDELLSTIQTRDPLKIHDALVIYTARLFQSSALLRGNRKIGEIRFDSIDPRGWWVGPDKPSKASPGTRGGVTPNMALRQLEELFRFRVHLATTASEHLRPALRQACEARHAIFWLINPGAQPRTVQTSDIRPPESSGLPVHWGRSRYRMLLKRDGVLPRHIYSLLGHVWNGYAPFGPHTTESLSAASALLGPALERVLTRDGWRHIALPAALTDRRTVEWPSPHLIDVLAFRDAAVQPAGESPSRGKRFSVEQKNQHRDFVTRLLLPLERRRSSEESVAPRIEVSETHVEDLVRAVAHQYPKETARIDACLRILRARIIWHRRNHKWSGLLPPVASAPPVVHPAFVETHLHAARLNQVLRDHMKSPRSFGGRKDVHSRFLRTVSLLILDRVVYNRDQLKGTISLLATRPCDPTDPAHLPGFAEVPIGDTRRCVALSQELSILISNQPIPSSFSWKAVAKKLHAEIKSLLGAFDGSAVNVLFRLASLGSRIECPGIDWSLCDRHDQGTLSLSRTLDVIYDQCRGGYTTLESTKTSEPVDLRHAILGRQSIPEARYRQYMLYRRKLYYLTEPGAAKRGLPPARFARARRQARLLIENPNADRTVAMLVSFAFELFREQETRVRLSTVYKSLTAIGRRILLSLGDEDLTALDEFGLATLFRDVIQSAPAISQANVTRVLARFYFFHRSILPELENTSAFAGYSNSEEAQSFPVIVTHREHQACLDSFEAAASSGGISRSTARSRSDAMTLMHRRALRVGEVTHAQKGDSCELYGERFLFIRNNSAGRVKTEAGKRLISLPDKTCIATLPPAELSVKHSSRSERSAPLLFDEVRGRDLGLALSDMRETLARCTGDANISLHALRHSCISFELLEMITGATGSRDLLLEYARRTSRFGQASVHTAHEHYWHLAHLLPLPLPKHRLTSSQLSILTGTTSCKIRQDRRRHGQTSSSPEGPVKRRADAGQRAFSLSHWSNPSLACDPVRDASQFVAPNVDRAERLTQCCQFVAHLHRDRSIEKSCERIALSIGFLRELINNLHDLVLAHRASIIPDSLEDLAVLGCGPPDQRPGRIQHLKLSRLDRNALLELLVSCVPEHPLTALPALIRSERSPTALELRLINDLRSSITWKGWDLAPKSVRVNVLLVLCLVSAAEGMSSP